MADLMNHLFLKINNLETGETLMMGTITQNSTNRTQTNGIKKFQNYNVGGANLMQFS